MFRMNEHCAYFFFESFSPLCGLIRPIIFIRFSLFRIRYFSIFFSEMTWKKNQSQKQKKKCAFFRFWTHTIYLYRTTTILKFIRTCALIDIWVFYQLVSLLGHVPFTDCPRNIQFDDIHFKESLLVFFSAVSYFFSNFWSHFP